MKKIFVLLAVLVLIMLFEVPAFAENAANSEAVTDSQEPVDLGDIRMGGWSVSEDASLKDEDIKLFEKALEGFVGVNYTPILCLGHQQVSGMNYCYLCRARVVYPDAEPYYALVYIYEDLNGNASLLDIQTLELGIS